MHRLRLLFHAILASMLVGCVPNATTYYRPSLAGGTVLASHCVPTESNLVFQVGPLWVHAVANQAMNGVIVNLDLSSQSFRARQPLASWRTFHFNEGGFSVRDLDSGATTQNLQARVFRQDKSNTLSDPYRLQAGQGSYWVDVYLPNPPPERFLLLGPSIVIDGLEMQFPPLRFERKVWVGVSPFNC